VLGYLGIAETRDLPLGFSRHTSDIVYWDLQFFTLDSDSLQGAASISWKLQVARFVIPMATFYAIAEAARHIFSGQWRRRSIRKLQGHVLVCGGGMAASLLTQRLLAFGETVVSIGSGLDGHPERRHFQLAGDPQSPETLKAAAVGRAKTVYAFAEDTAANLGTALTAEAVHRPRGGQFTSYVHVEEPELCQALRARRLVMASEPGARVDFVNSSELAARVLVEGRVPGQAIGHLLIVGLGPFGRSLLLELTRQQRVLTYGRRAKLTVVDDRSASIMDDLVARYPFLNHWERTTIECSPAEFHLAGWSSQLAEGQEPDQTYLCGADPVSALRGALTAVRLWRGRPQSLVVCLENSLTYGDVFHTEAEALLDGLGGVLHIFGVLEAACGSEFDGQEMIEQLARSIHETYQASVRGAASATAGSEVMVPWHVLPETYRRSSRAQAAHVGFKLREIGCMTAPTESGTHHFAFADEEVEHLARLEHQRWLDERRASNWRYGRVRNDLARTSPSMVPWAELTEEDKAKDREFVLALPDLLADVGLRIVRTGEQRALRPVH